MPQYGENGRTGKIHSAAIRGEIEMTNESDLAPLCDSSQPTVRKEQEEWEEAGGDGRR